MEHRNFISLLILLILVVILYKLHSIELKTADTAMCYYIVLLEVMTLGFDHIYYAFGDWCL